MKLIKALKRLYKVAFQDDEYSRYVIAEAVASLIYPKYKFSEYGRSYFNDMEFHEYYEKYVGNNFHSYDRKYFLSQRIKLTDNLEGDVVECGVYEGASSLLMFKQLKGTNKKLHLFDSFEGLSIPEAVDSNYWAEGDLSVSEQTVRNNLPKSENILYYKGWIPDKFNMVNEIKFSFVHLDVDLYQPTHDSLRFFYSKMVVGGIILCDDYGFDSCPGAKKALDEFFSNKEKIINVPTGQAFIIKR